MISEDLNLGTEPFLDQINELLDDNPQLSRAIRLVTWMAVTEGSDRCGAISSHTPCVMRMLQRMTTLVILALKNPTAIDCLLEATCPVMHTMFPMLHWDFIESDDEGRIDL